MADINVRINGDSNGAQQAMRGVGMAAGDMGDGVEDATEKVDELTESTDKSSESQANSAIKFALVAKAVKEVVKFVGDSVKEYLKSADAQKELVQVSKDLEEAQTNLKKTVGETALAFAKEAQLAEAAQGALGLIQTALKGDTQENIDRETRLSQVIEARAALASAKANELNLKTQAASDMVDEAEIRLRELTTAQGLTPSLADSAAARLLQRQKEDLAKKAAQEAADAARAAANEQLQIIIDAANKEYDARKKAADELLKLKQQYSDAAIKAEQDEADAILKTQMDAAAKQAEAMQQAEQASLDASIAQSKKTIAQAEKDLAATQQQWQNLGTAIGSSMVSAFTSMLNTMLDGGPNDPSKIILAVLDVIWQVAGYAIGSAMGNPVLGQAIGTLGSAATHGIAAAAKKGQGGGATSMTSRAHDGAWIGAPKYHDGGWAFDEMPAILKMGERVLSEQEISRMGGPQSVDSAARGSGMSMPPMQVNVQAIDSRNATESFVRDLGLALKRARRSGLGSLAIA